MNTLEMNERRKLLRAALESNDTNEISGFAAAFADANEEDRAALARTLPAAKLFKAEGPTPRACYVLAALGKPAAVAEIDPDWVVPPDPVAAGLRSRQLADAAHKRLQAAEPVMEAFFIAAARDRSTAWQLALIEALSEEFWVVSKIAWPIARALIEAHALAPESEKYLNWFLRNIVWGRDGKGKSGAEIATALTRSDGVLMAEFWALFRVEGMGGHWLLSNNDDWGQAIAILCDTLPGFRARLLDESLGALLRDFSANNIRWYLHLQRILDPVPEEVATRADTYLALLSTGPGTTVGLAQEMLARAIDRIDADALLDASPGVLGRSEKKLLAAQLKLLAALVKAHPGYAARVSELVTGMAESWPADVAVSARKLILPNQRGAAATGAAVDIGTLAGTPVAVPEPRREAIARAPESLAPLAGEDELWELVSACLEGVGHGRDLPRILGHLGSHPGLVPGQPVLARAQEVLDSVWDKMDASPRRHLSDLLLARAGRRSRQIRYEGYRRFHMKPAPTHTPTALLMEQFDASARQASTAYFAKLRQWLAQLYAGTGQFISAPLPRAACAWNRVLLPPGKGYFRSDEVLGMNPKPVWLPAGETPGETCAGCDLGVGGTQEEYTLRAEEAREQDGFDQIVQWAAWLLSENTDTLAAIYHPVLDAAVRVVNVRGISALLAALGATRQAPRGPVWSALALGLSAKMPEHRAAAAEAVASLAESGLLDPAPFAAEIAAHLKDEFALAGRLSAALADAASINPIAGYRVLQTLAALLPHLDGINQAAKLVELAARLSADYGTPIPVPDAFASKRKGASVMAVALRALDAVIPHPTPLAEDAAAQARRSASLFPGSAGTQEG
ncbi:MAG: DUF6493 family protein [Betaproteobacteria bacterium]|nr:DUF6493 family protein [Betaproteobacteria bacterium]